LGSLVLFSLPIGNQGDITIRTKDVLLQDGIFLAEDTRVLKDFLRTIGAKIEGKKFISFHEHNDKERIEFVLKLLSENDFVYLTSDAGSPIISDPAYPIVKAALENNFIVLNLPGVSSVISAIELGGLPPYPFSFYGFLPKEKNKRSETLKNLPNGLSIFFESPHRILDTLELIEQTLPDCKVSLCREMSKKFESIYRFEIKDLKKMKENIILKGEFVLCVYRTKTDGSGIFLDLKLKELVSKYLSQSGSKKDLAKIFAKITGEDAKTIYDKLAQ